MLKAVLIDGLIDGLGQQFFLRQCEYLQVFTYMGSSPLEATRGAAAEEDGRILGRELVVLKKEPALQALAFDLGILLMRQARKRVPLGHTLWAPADLGPRARSRARAEPFESEPPSSRTSIILTAHTESNPAASEGIAESDVDVAAEGAATSSRREPDVRSGWASDRVGFRFHLRGALAV